MKVDVTSVGSFQKKITFVVPAERVRNQLDQAYKRLAGRVRLQGFRPGKAPRNVLEARFGPQIESDVAQDLIQTSWSNALKDHDLQPVGQPSLSESGAVADREGFKFTITVDVRPDIELSTWTGLDVVYPAVDVTADEVEQMVKSRLEGSARLSEVTDRAAQKGDMALVELEASDGGAEVAKELGTMIRTEGDPYYPGVEDLIVGMDVGSEKSGKVTFGADARTEAVAGRELDVTVKLLSLQAHSIPELTDELAQELGYEGGVGGMRAALEQQLRSARDEAARNQARANLLEVLIAANPFDVPEGMTQQSLQMLMDELRLQQAMRTGRDPKTIGFSDAQVADLRMRAAFAAKAGLILEWVTKKEGIEVTDADVDARFQQLADDRGQTVEAVRGWFKKEGAIDELRERILEEKTLDWLLERANFVEPAPAGSAPTEKAEKAEKPAKKSKAKKAEPAPEPEAAPAEAAPAAGVDTSVLDGAIGALKDALANGSLDAQLDDLLAAEQAGRARKGALSAIEARRKAIAG